MKKKMWAKEDKYSVPASLTLDGPKKQIRQYPVRMPKIDEQLKEELNQ